MKKKLLILIVVLVIVLVVPAVIIIVTSGEKLEQLAAKEISNVELAGIADGRYTGSYTVLPISVKVDVTVIDHRIIGIDLTRHINGQGAAAEIIPDNVITAQSLEVDIVTGATYSSKVILLAIEDALKGALD